MKINIYYGGRGIIDDPTIYVINKMQEVLKELNVQVQRYDLHEYKANIVTLPQTLKEVDGIILASTVEWYGIGGYMQQFLDACWLYGDKESISKIYMCPIVMSTTYGEREGKLNLATAWEILGGKPCSGICGYIADTTSFEMNKDYISIIEKKAENMYRTINQKIACLPASNQAAKQMVATTTHMELTPQETEQLSQYVANEEYVQRQKEDIQELSSYFKDKLTTKESNLGDNLLQGFKENFVAQPSFYATYKIYLSTQNTPLLIKVNNAKLECSYGNEAADVEIQMEQTTLLDIMDGRMTFQRSFMAGSMKMKGEFKVLRTLDQLFPFKGNN